MKNLHSGFASGDLKRPRVCPTPGAVHLSGKLRSIAAYQAGVPGNGKPFPDGAKMAKIHWNMKQGASAFHKSAPRFLKLHKRPTPLALSAGVRACGFHFLVHALSASTLKCRSSLCDASAEAQLSIPLREAIRSLRATQSVSFASPAYVCATPSPGLDPRHVALSRTIERSMQGVSVSAGAL
jgi:hypothetical protein